MTEPCWLLENALVDSCGTLVPLKSMVGLRDCSGRMDPCHLIPKQLLKREFPRGATTFYFPGLPGFEPRKVKDWTLDEILKDPSLIVPGCRRHHGLLDTARRLKIPREALPWQTESFATEFDLLWYLDREFGELKTEAA